MLTRFMVFCAAAAVAGIMKPGSQNRGQNGHHPQPGDSRPVFRRRPPPPVYAVMYET